MQNTLAVISLNRIIENAAALQNAARRPLIAVVKDDAYGHGAERVSLALEPYVSGFAVSSVDEGAALRTVGVSKEILVLTPPLCEEEVLRAASLGLTVSLTCLAVQHLVLRVQEKYALPVKAHIAVNTGMNRYGFRPERVKDALKHADGAVITGVYSHLFLPESAREVRAQVRLFERACSSAPAGRCARFIPTQCGIFRQRAGRLRALRSTRCARGLRSTGICPRRFGGKSG